MNILSALQTTLSIFSAHDTINQRKVKIKVIPSPGWFYPQGGPCISVEVINLSSFPITINEIGLLRKDKSRYLLQSLTNSQSLPIRLESRDSISAFASAQGIDLNMVLEAYSKTSCGTTQIGDSPGWKQLREE